MEMSDYEIWACKDQEKLAQIFYQQQREHFRIAEEQVKAKLYALTNQKRTPPSVKALISYYCTVKAKIGHIPSYWDEFQAIMKLEGSENVPVKLVRVNRLFHAYPDLKKGFEMLVPPSLIYLLYSDDLRNRLNNAIDKYYSINREIPNATEIVDAEGSSTSVCASTSKYTGSSFTGPSSWGHTSKSSQGLFGRNNELSQVVSGSNAVPSQVASGSNAGPSQVASESNAGPSQVASGSNAGPSSASSSRYVGEDISISSGSAESQTFTTALNQIGTSSVETGETINETEESVLHNEMGQNIESIMAPITECYNAKKKDDLKLNHFSDHSIASVSKYGSFKQLRFFDKVKDALGYQEVYDNFMKCLNLFNQDVITRTELVKNITPFLGKFPALLKEFRDILGIPESGEYIDSLPHKHVNLKKIDPDTAMEIDYCCGRKEVASYRAIPKTYPEKCSGRTPMCKEVLNDVWVSFPTWSEESTCLPSVKTQYEESMYRIEDEQFELDMAIQTNAYGIQLLEEIQKKMEKMTDEEKSKYSLNDALGGSSAVLVRRFLQRIYGEKTKELIEGLKRNPVVAVPIVLNRLRVREEGWKDVKKQFNVVWKNQVADTYPKALDNKGISFKQADSKNLRAKTLLNEIEAVYEEKKQKIQEGSVGGFPGPHMVLRLRNQMVFKDAIDFILPHIKRQPGIYKDDRQGIKDLLTNFIFDFFGIDYDVSSMKESDIKKDGNISSQSADGPCEDDVEIIKDGDEEQNTNPKKGSRKFTIKKSARTHLPYTVFFVNNAWYIFFRLFFILVNRLALLLRHSEKIEKEGECRRSMRNSDQPSTSADPGELSLYSFFLGKISLLLSGKMDSSSFEETARKLLDTHAYLSYTFDKVIPNIIKQIHQLSIEDTSKQCTKQCIEHVYNVSVHGISCPWKLRELEESYMKRVMRIIGDDNCYRVVWHNIETLLTIELLDPVKEMYEDPTVVERFSDYIENYINVDMHDTEVEICLPFLNRNLKKGKKFWWSQYEKRKNKLLGEEKMETKKDTKDEKGKKEQEANKCSSKGKGKRVKGVPLKGKSKVVKEASPEKKTIEEIPSILKRTHKKNPLPTKKSSSEKPVKKVRFLDRLTERSDSEKDHSGNNKDEERKRGVPTQTEKSTLDSKKPRSIASSIPVTRKTKRPSRKRGRRKKGSAAGNAAKSSKNQMESHKKNSSYQIPNDQSNEDSNKMNIKTSTATKQESESELPETIDDANNKNDEDEDSIEISADDLLFHLKQTGMALCEHYSESFCLKSSKALESRNPNPFSISTSVENPVFPNYGETLQMSDEIRNCNEPKMVASEDMHGLATDFDISIVGSKDSPRYITDSFQELSAMKAGSVCIAPAEQEVAASVEISSSKQDSILTTDSMDQLFPNSETASSACSSENDKLSKDGPSSDTMENERDSNHDIASKKPRLAETSSTNYWETICYEMAVENMIIEENIVAVIYPYTYKQRFADGTGDFIYRRGALLRARKALAKVCKLASEKFGIFHKVWLDRYVTPNMLKSCHLWMIRSEPDKFRVDCITVNDYTKPPYAPYTKYFVRYFKRGKQRR